MGAPIAAAAAWGAHGATDSKAVEPREGIGVAAGAISYTRALNAARLGRELQKVHTSRDVQSIDLWGPVESVFPASCSMTAACKAPPLSKISRDVNYFLLLLHSEGASRSARSSMVLAMRGLLIDNYTQEGQTTISTRGLSVESHEAPAQAAVSLRCLKLSCGRSNDCTSYQALDHLKIDRRATSPQPGTFDMTGPKTGGACPGGSPDSGSDRATLVSCRPGTSLLFISARWNPSALSSAPERPFALRDSNGAAAPNAQASVRNR